MSYWTAYFPAILLMGAGMTLLVAPLTNTAMNCVAEEFAGLASGINNAIARAGADAVIVQDLRLAAADIPEGLTGEPARAVRAAIQDAFLDGYHNTLRACVGLTLAGALLAFLLIRGGGKNATLQQAGRAIE